MRVSAALVVGLGAFEALAGHNVRRQSGVDDIISSNTTETGTAGTEDATISGELDEAAITPTDSLSESLTATDSGTLPTETNDADIGGDLNIGRFQYLGCIASTDGLPGFSIEQSSNVMTRAVCATHCGNESRFFGVAGRDCFCGDDLGNAQQVGNAVCDVGCPGNPDTTCGGAHAGLTSRKRQSIPSVIAISVYVNLDRRGGPRTTETDGLPVTKVPGPYPPKPDHGYGPCHGPWCPRPIPKPGPKFPCHGDECSRKIVCFGDWCHFDFPCLHDWCKIRVVCWDDVCRPEPCRDGHCHKKVCCKDGKCEFDTCKGPECDKKVVCFGDHCEDEKCEGDHCRKKFVCHDDKCKHEDCHGDECHKKHVCHKDECKPEPPCHDCKPAPVKPVEPCHGDKCHETKPHPEPKPCGGDDCNDHNKKPVHPTHVEVAGAEKAIASFAALAFAGAAMLI